MKEILSIYLPKIFAYNKMVFSKLLNGNKSQLSKEFCYFTSVKFVIFQSVRVKPRTNSWTGNVSLLPSRHPCILHLLNTENYESIFYPSRFFQKIMMIFLSSSSFRLSSFLLFLRLIGIVFEDASTFSNS